MRLDQTAKARLTRAINIMLMSQKAGIQGIMYLSIEQVICILIDPTCPMNFRGMVV